MKYRKFYNKILLAILFIFISGGVFAGMIPLKVYLNNRPIPVKSIVKNGEIFVSLRDLSRHFPGRMKLDSKSGRLDIISGPVPDKAANVKKVPKTPEKGIMGSISLRDNSNKDFFLKNIKVTLYNYNKDIPDDISLTQLKRFATDSDNEYMESHGKVRETVSDDSGNFYLGGIPKGKYEVIAIYSPIGGKTHLFWRNIVEVKGNQLIKIKFDSGNAGSI